jgi:pyruvate dehydrogenase E2 component (dihydrolipoamide acetyltransferase)
MAHEIVVPRQGWSMDEGAFGGWLKGEGEAVRAGEPLFVLESDKAAQDIESLDSGILRIPPDAPQVGDKVVVGQTLAWLVAEGERAPFEAVPVPAGGEQARPQPPEAHSGGSRGLDPPYPFRREATAAGGSQTRPQLPTTGPRAAPRARRVARELGIEWSQLAGSGRGGRIRERDVRAAASGSQPPTAPMDEILAAARRPVAIVGIVENGLVRPLDPTVKLSERSRVIIVATEET